MVAFSGSLTSTISLPELIWFLIGMVGLVVSWMNLVDCWRDSIAVNLSGRNGMLRIAAQSNTREEALRVVKCLVICCIGVAAMVAPPSNPAQPVTPLALIVTMGLFFLGSLTVVGSLAARKMRSTIREYDPEG